MFVDEGERGIEECSYYGCWDQGDRYSVAQDSKWEESDGYGNQFILSKWSEANGTVYVPSNDDENLIAEVADGWWLQSTSTLLLLAVLVHRSNPDIIADPTTVPTGTTHA